MAGKNSDRFDIVNGKQLALLIAPTICFVVAAAVDAASPVLPYPEDGPAQDALHQPALFPTPRKFTAPDVPESVQMGQQQEGEKAIKCGHEKGEQ